MPSPARHRLITKLLLTFGLLIGLIILNGIYSTWRWHESASQKLDKELDAKLSLGRAMLLSELDKFKHIALVVREQNPKFVEFLEYDNYRAINIVLQNVASLYDIDLLLFFSDDRVVASSRILPDKPPQLPPRYLHVYLRPGTSLEVLPAALFQSGAENAGRAVLCFKAVVPLHYDVGDVAGHILMLKVLNHHQDLAQKIADLTGAEIALYDWQQHPVLSSFADPKPAYPHAGELRRGRDGRYFVKLDRFTNADGQLIAELAVALDSRPFLRARRQLILDNLLPFLITALVSGFLLLFLKLRVFDCIAGLSRVLQQVAAGDLRSRLPLADRAQERSADEIVQMATNFNRMMDRLEESYLSLDINRQTLEDLNAQLYQEVRERKKAEAALREATLEAETANRAKSVFLANMSHEIRTPLNAVLGYAQILQRDPRLGGEQRRAVDTVARSGQHLLELINDVLDLSKIEAGRMELKPAAFDLAELAHDLAGLFHQRCAEKRLTWRMDCPPGPLAVRGDAGKLRQVLINLLGNAVKFTARGWVALRITPQRDALYAFEVGDSGAGIEPDAQESIFEAFRQEAQGREKGGTGLGLSIARKQVELMGGRLTLVSQPGQGARFSFAIPLPPAQDAPPARPALPGEVERLAPGQQVTALVVDDVALNREVLAKLLRDIGVTVREADNGAAALAAAREQVPDIVFMDYRMPGMDGIEALEKLAALTAGRGKRVMLTASAFAHEREKFTRAGCHGFISKPFQAEQIYACLRQLLGIEYQYRTSAAAPPEAAAGPLRVPAALLRELREAAEFCLITRLEQALAELSALGPAQARWAAELRELAAAYRMETLVERLAEVQSDADV